MRSRRRTLSLLERNLRASLLLLASACAPTAPPPAPAQRPPAPPPPPPAAPAPPEPEPDRNIVEIRGSAGAVCGRAERGALHCWGHVKAPGETDVASYTQPRLMQGLPPLAGFTLVYSRVLVGWDAQGQVFSVVKRRPQGPFEVQAGVYVGNPATRRDPYAILGYQLEQPRVRAASSQCLLTLEGQALCKDGTSDGPNFALMPGHYLAIGSGIPCGVAADGRVFELNPSNSPLRTGGAIKEIPAYGVAPLAGVAPATSLACFRDKAQRAVACGLDPQGALRCTDPGVASRLQRLAEGRALREVRADRAACITRDDGQVRCLDVPPRDQSMHASFVGLDASRGYVLGPSAFCALGADGVPRCWGERDSPSLGDGSGERLAAPQRIEGFQGVVELSHGGGITCARFDANRVRCFGRIGAQVVEPRDLKLPEPVDHLIGGFPLCVRGAKSQGYFCRDAWRSFFPGSLPDGFEPLRDTSGRPLGGAVTSVSVDSGLGIGVLMADGRTGRFDYRANARPLRIDFARPLYAEPIRKLVNLDDSAIRQDGRGIIIYDGRTVVTPVPVVAMAVRKQPCFLDEARQVHCYDPSLTRTSVVARDVVELEAVGAFLSAAGEVFHAYDEEQKSVAVRKIEGLPPMAELANECGRSVAGEVWCWGWVSHLPGPAHRLEPRPVVFR